MTRYRLLITGAALLAMAGGLRAQTKTTTQSVKGAAHVTSTRMTGVVDWVQGNTLVARMQPNGHYHVFSVQPGREFVIANPGRSPFDAVVVLPAGARATVDGARLVPPWAE